MAIGDWIGELKTVMMGITGMAAVYKHDEVPGTLIEFPCMILMPQIGSGEYSVAGPNMTVHQVQCTLYVAPQLLTSAYGTAVSMINLWMRAVVANTRLNGTVAYCRPAAGRPWYQGPGAIGFNYGDKNLLGVIFSLDVKERESGLTVS